MVPGCMPLHGDNLNNVRCEASRHFKNKKREYLKDAINELATHSKNKNIRDLHQGIYEFKKGYQHTPNLVKDENGDLLRFPQHFEWVENLLLSAIERT
jgi:chemotaxis methyl-accepting protein methylase